VIGGFLTLVLSGLVALALVAKIVRVPYPVVFVLGGLGLALIPGVPTIALDPNLIFLLFLPPLLFGDAWTTDSRAFSRFRRSIFSLAIGLVVCTSVVVAFVVHGLMGLPLAVGFVLGGILSPTDAVATDAIAETTGIPNRLAVVLNGESLVNDASGLVIYRFALAAVATGAFSLLAATVQFVYVIAAGIAVGVAGSWLLAKFLLLIRRKGLADEVIAVSISLVTPFAVYVPADAIGGSGVLAAVTAGFLLSRNPRLFDAESRIVGRSVWNLLTFTFNGAAFVLIGLQLRGIVHGLDRYSPSTLIGWSLAVTAALIVVRFFWCFVVLYGTRALSPRDRAREGRIPWQAAFLASCAGMRGIVSLAAALALPTTLPARDLLLFVSFVAILVSLVGEGLLLPWLIRWLSPALADDSDEHDHALVLARTRAAEAARDRLRALQTGDASGAEREVAAQLEAAFDQTVRRPDGDAQYDAIERKLRHEAYAAERAALVTLRRSGTIDDAVYREIEWEIDLDESRWS
jgi:CPA1 family monovalent cation:H+ antiporter